VAHTCNPSYSGGKDQEDRGWSLGKWFVRPYLENSKSHTQNGCGVTEVVGHLAECLPTKLKYLIYTLVMNTEIVGGRILTTDC
jgi:hypothetical protein